MKTCNDNATASSLGGFIFLYEVIFFQGWPHEPLSEYCRFCTSTSSGVELRACWLFFAFIACSCIGETLTLEIETMGVGMVFGIIHLCAYMLNHYFTFVFVGIHLFSVQNKSEEEDLDEYKR
jgi:hypothetical protein